jgi:solute carrier family 66 (lysosomal lysine-arginine transporter), member 1
MVLLGQCFYYKGFTLTDKVKTPPKRRNGHNDAPTERSALLPHRGEPSSNSPYAITPAAAERRSSLSSIRDAILSVDATHLSPVTPLVEHSKPSDPPPPPPAQFGVQAVLFNLLIIVLVCAAGVFGWWLGDTNAPAQEDPTPSKPLEFNTLGQVFGYICAALYLGSRIPQLLLNYRRKSTEGISMLFFLFACIGNVTYVLSIMAYDPPCADGPKHCLPGEASALYGRYFLVNLSWLLGSFGTLLLDFGVFVQFFMYLDHDEDSGSEDDEAIADDQGAIVRRSQRRERAVYEES